MSQPLVSILAVCYNHEKYLKQTLDSIRDQTFSNFELLIIDNCSTDDSQSLIQIWLDDNPHINASFIKHQQQIGLCRLLNIALSQLTGKYLQMISCDDRLLPFKLARHTAILNDLDESYALVFGDAYLIDTKSELYYPRFISRANSRLLRIPESDMFDVLLEDGNFIPGMSCLTRIDYLRSVGGYDENISYEDYDMWLKLSFKYKFKFDSEIAVQYRIHESNYDKSLHYKIENFPIWIKYARIRPTLIKNKLIQSLKAMYQYRHSNTLKSYGLYKEIYGRMLGFSFFYNLQLSFSSLLRFNRLFRNL